MKTSHFVTFITLVLFEVLLCISFYFIYTGAVQRSFIDEVREFSKQKSQEFRRAEFYLESSEDSESIEKLNSQHEWIQHNYQTNPLLVFHIYRNPKTNEVIFSNSRNSKLDTLKSEYIRQWSIDFYNKTDYTIFSIGNVELVGLIIQIEDEVLPVGKLELIYDYSPVVKEVGKLRNILIWFASGLAIMLFVVFLILGIVNNKKSSKRNKNTSKTIDYDKPVSDKSPVNNKNQDIKKKTISKNIKLNRMNVSKNINRNDAIDEEEIKIQTGIYHKNKHNSNQDESDFLNDTKSKNRKYIHKVRL
jgi:hypothetical protein